MTTPRAARLRTLRWLPWVVLAILAGCKVGPDFHAPQTSVPDAFTMPTTAPSTQPLASVAVQRSFTAVQWWRTFNDPMLNFLVDEAIQNNLDLKQAIARIKQARAARGVAAAGLWPSVTGNAGYTRSRDRRSSGAAGGAPSGGAAGGGASGGGFGPDLYQASLDASWEIDVFGGVRRGVEAAEADIQTAIEDSRDILVTLLGEVAMNYLDLRGLQREIAIARQNLEAQQKTAELTRRRFQGGFVSGLDVANAEALVASTQSQIPALESAAEQAMYNLGLLLGKFPTALVEKLTPTAPIPVEPPQVPVGLPSELLRRRPDIRRSEAQVHAATARIGVATADLFPRFSLNGLVGVASNKFAGLGNWNNGTWSFGPSASWSIFNAGLVRSNIAVQNALQEQALINYERTVLIALRDVQSALVAYTREQERRQSLIAAVNANRRAVDLSTKLYTQGQTDFLNVLQAQRALYVAEDALVQSDQAVATNLVALYKALGGGWEDVTPSTQPAK